MVATLAFALVARMSKSGSAGLAVRAVLRAEGVKVLVVVFQLWFVISHYTQLVSVIFLATFIVATLIQSMAVFVRET